MILIKRMLVMISSIHYMLANEAFPLKKMDDNILELQL